LIAVATVVFAHRNPTVRGFAEPNLLLHGADRTPPLGHGAGP
jgi:hypothetical protein